MIDLHRVSQKCRRWRSVYCHRLGYPVRLGSVVTQMGPQTLANKVSMWIQHLQQERLANNSAPKLQRYIYNEIYRV